MYPQPKELLGCCPYPVVFCHCCSIGYDYASVMLEFLLDYSMLSSLLLQCLQLYIMMLHVFQHGVSMPLVGAVIKNTHQSQCHRDGTWRELTVFEPFGQADDSSRRKFLSSQIWSHIGTIRTLNFTWMSTGKKCNSQNRRVTCVVDLHPSWPRPLHFASPIAYRYYLRAVPCVSY